jgi:hypothetical protein
MRDTIDSKKIEERIEKIKNIQNTIELLLRNSNINKENQKNNSKGSDGQ